MKILHIYRTCYPESNGGVEQVIRSISEGAHKSGVSSKVLALSHEKKTPYIVNNVEIQTVKKSFEIASNGFSFQLLKAFKNLSCWADIIHFHYPWPTGDLLSLINNKPSIVTYHSDIIRQRMLKIIYKPLEQLFFKRVDRIIATSPNYARSSPNLTKYSKKVSIIPLGIDETIYPHIKSNTLTHWQAKVGSGFFLFVGVLRYYKGLQFLLKASKINGLPVVIAGDGPEKDNLKKYIQKNNLTNVKMVGFISEEDKVALHTLSKAFIFPSHLRSEAFGISLLEAQMFSKPIISADIGTGSSYVNINGITGLTTRPADAYSLSQAMVTLQSDNALCTTLGKNARNRFQRNFTPKSYTNSYLAIYNKLLK